jgi:hypothetical protein
MITVEIIVLVISLIQVHSYVQCTDFKTMPGPGNDVGYYIFGSLPQKNYSSMKNYCNTTILPGSTLPYVTSSSILQFICPGGFGPYVWLPLVQKQNQTTPKTGWIWENGTVEAVLPAPWTGAEPNDANGGGESNAENCAALDCHNAPTELGFIDYACSGSGTAFCEIQRNIFFVSHLNLTSC